MATVLKIVCVQICAEIYPKHHEIILIFKFVWFFSFIFDCLRFYANVYWVQLCNNTESFGCGVLPFCRYMGTTITRQACRSPICTVSQHQGCRSPPTPKKLPPILLKCILITCHWNTEKKIKILWTFKKNGKLKIKETDMW